MHSFIRSYANKTIGLKGNKKKSIMITTENHAYLCEANGYLKGEIVKVWQIDGNEDAVNQAIKRAKNGTYSGRKTFDSTSKRTRDESRRNGSYIYDVDNDGTETRDVDIAGEESESGGERNSREANKNQEKIGQRSIQTDSEGRTLSEDQSAYQRVIPLADRDILEMAAEQIQV